MSWEEGVQSESQRGTREITWETEGSGSSRTRLGSHLWEMEGLENSQWALCTAQPHRTVSGTDLLLFLLLASGPTESACFLCLIVISAMAYWTPSKVLGLLSLVPNPQFPFEMVVRSPLGI